MIKYFNETFDLIKEIKIYSKEQIFKNNFYRLSNFENTLCTRFYIKITKNNFRIYLNYINSYFACYIYFTTRRLK